jgi:glutaminyl-peptide cyclotransferase
VKILETLALMFICAGCRGENARTSTGFSGASAYQYAGAQVAFGPRVPGTPAAKAAGDWIIAQMKKRADTVIVQSFDYRSATGKIIPMRNIIARFRPELADRILYVTHWDSRPTSTGRCCSPEATTDAEKNTPVPGANDGASGVGMFIALGDLLKKNKPNVGVDLLFTDGEDYGNFGPPAVDVLVGAQYFADHPLFTGYRPLFAVLFDMIGDKDLRIPQEGNSINSAPEVVQRVWEIAADLGHADVFVPENGGAIDDDHLPLLKAGYRIIDVIDLTYPPHHTPQDTMDKISAKSLGVVGDVAAALILRQ